PHVDPAAARHRLGAIGRAYLRFAREEPGWFATAFALPQRHAYDETGGADGTGPDRSPLGQLRTVLDELAEAGALRRERRDGLEYPIWSSVHGLAVLTSQGPLRDVPGAARQRLDQLTLAFIDEGLA
ncbi:MAG: TetR-like C-terminal domain-containing protein, partial [Streptosporangiaceae bacterium]